MSRFSHVPERKKKIGGDRVFPLAKIKILLNKKRILRFPTQHFSEEILQIFILLKLNLNSLKLILGIKIFFASDNGAQVLAHTHTMCAYRKKENKEYVSIIHRSTSRNLMLNGCVLIFRKRGTWHNNEINKKRVEE